MPGVVSSPRVWSSAQGDTGGQCPLCLGTVAGYVTVPGGLVSIAGAGRVLRAAQHPALPTEALSQIPPSALPRLRERGCASFAPRLCSGTLPWERKGLRNCLRCLPGNLGSRLLCFPGNCVQWCCPACVPVVQAGCCPRPVAFLFCQPAMHPGSCALLIHTIKLLSSQADLILPCKCAFSGCGIPS